MVDQPVWCVHMYSQVVESAMRRVHTAPELSDAQRLQGKCAAIHELYRVVKPGGGVYLPQTYEADAVAQGR